MPRDAVRVVCVAERLLALVDVRAQGFTDRGGTHVAVQFDSPLPALTDRGHVEWYWELAGSQQGHGSVCASAKQTEGSLEKGLGHCLSKQRASLA